MPGSNNCVECNKEENWLELEFMSEMDEAIDDLPVTITHTSGATYTKTTKDGAVSFSDIAAGEWRVTVAQETLLTETEKYPARAEEDEDSPVEKRAGEETGEAHGNAKIYKQSAVGDFWDEAPQDEFLTEYHAGMDGNADKKDPGFKVTHNKTYVFEVKALRSYLPYFVDTYEFNLTNSYTFALFSALAYATEDKDVDNEQPSKGKGSIKTVITDFKRRVKPEQAADVKVNWLVEEVPYSQAFNAKYYADKEVNAQGYILFNDQVAILGVRGTEAFFQNGPVNQQDNKIYKWIHKLPLSEDNMLAKGFEAYDKLQDSSGKKDVATDLDAKQVQASDLGNTFVHQGFYQYSKALWEQIVRDFTRLHKDKRLFVCGHSLGGAGATILAALIKEILNATELSLYTYGSPRAGTKSFVKRYSGIMHQRHVNNYDFVPTVPFTWCNTDFDGSNSFWKQFLPPFTRKLISIKLFDEDDDTYYHHGNLTQLFTYDQQEHQILLSPHQTHVTSFQIQKLVENDKYQFLDKYKDHADLMDYGKNHSMTQYIPNLYVQLKDLLNESLVETYQSAVKEMHNFRIHAENQHHKALKEFSSLVDKYREQNGYIPVYDSNRIHKLALEIDVINIKIDNYLLIEKEISRLIKNDEFKPTGRILMTNQSLPESIKEQVIS